jgi:ribonuclease P protein component
VAGSQTFSKRERLQRGSEFRRIFDLGRKRVGKLAVLYALAGTPDPAASTAAPARRLGVVTSRKVGNAVARNRARRLVREVYRRHKHELQPNVELVIIARPAINDRPYADVEADLCGLFAAAKIAIA